MLARRYEKGCDGRGRLYGACAVVVAPAEGDNAAIAEIAMKLEGLERQLRELPDEHALSAAVMTLSR
jgi:hypothetical protein